MQALGAYFRALQAAEGVIPPHRGRPFIANIFPEVVGFSWFTISLMSMTYGDGNLPRFVNACISVTSSFLAALKGLATLPPLLKWHWSNSARMRNRIMLAIHSS